MRAREEDVPLDILSPIAGSVQALADVNDPAFASGVLGPGSAVIPTGTVIRSPVAGEVIVSMPHAYGLRTADGVEVLVHIGVDTVALNGLYFRSKARQSQKVEVGDVLCEIELRALVSAGFDPTVMVVVTNKAAARDVVPIIRDRVNAGETLITVIP